MVIVVQTREEHCGFQAGNRAICFESKLPTRKSRAIKSGSGLTQKEGVGGADRLDGGSMVVVV